MHKFLVLFSVLAVFAVACFGWGPPYSGRLVQTQQQILFNYGRNYSQYKPSVPSAPVYTPPRNPYVQLTYPVQVKCFFFGCGFSERKSYFYLFIRVYIYLLSLLYIYSIKWSTVAIAMALPTGRSMWTVWRGTSQFRADLVALVHVEINQTIDGIMNLCIRYMRLVH